MAVEAVALECSLVARIQVSGEIRAMDRSVVAFVAGRTAPPEKRMGHAGAIISGSSGTAQEKIEVFESCGVPVAEEPQEVAQLMEKALKGG